MEGNKVIGRLDAFLEGWCKIDEGAENKTCGWKLEWHQGRMIFSIFGNSNFLSTLAG